MSVEFFYPVCDHEPVVFVKSRGVRKQRTRVAIRAQAEKHQIESRERAGSEREEVADLLFISSGRSCGIWFLSRNPEHILWPHGYFCQQGLMRHAIVTLGMVRRHVALITPKKTDSIPTD